MQKKVTVGYVFSAIASLLLVTSIYYDLRNLRDNYEYLTDILNYTDGISFCVSMILTKIISITYLVSLYRVKKVTKRK